MSSAFIMRVDETVNWMVLYTAKFYTAVLLLNRQITMPIGDMLFLGTLAADYPMC